jgi:hypothetical protein
MSAWTPEPTGDPTADAILDDLRGIDELSPADEIHVYRTALDSLAQLLEEQPRVPGPS